MQIDWKEKRLVTWSWAETSLGFVMGFLVACWFAWQAFLFNESTVPPVEPLQSRIEHLETRLDAAQKLQVCDTDKACEEAYDRVAGLVKEQDK